MNPNTRMVTDMNERERQRFIGTLTVLSAQAQELIKALESGDDGALVPPSVIFMVAFSGVTDLFNVIAAAQWIDVGDLDRPIPQYPEDNDPED